MVFAATSFVRGIIRWLGRHDLSLLVILALAAAGVWAFAEVADAVLEREADATDRAILLAMRTTDLSDPVGPTWFEQMARDITALGGVTVLTGATLVVVGYLMLRRAFSTAIITAVAAVGAQLASSVMKLAFDRPRPDLMPAFANVYTASFPSGHAMVSAAVYLTFAIQLAHLHRDVVIRGYLLAAALVIVMAIGGSRVYLGVHWPTDVLAGWAAGGAWALVVAGGGRWWTARRERAAS